MSVLVQGDAGINGRPGLPGRKGEQVWLISSIKSILMSSHWGVRERVHGPVCVCVCVFCAWASIYSVLCVF